ncbi:MAG: hypothetical protein BroJett030_18370 [Alphaproteobacteria bacterium]|nr:MAG: hypothetical protein BroJett030_18370 [Alphaproteobacteria bacterium]
MIDLEPPFRLATAADAPVLAELVNHAGEGLPEYIWSTLAGPGEDPWEFGRRRQAQRAERGEVVVIDEGTGAVASLTGYPIAARPGPIADDLPALFRPLQELENLAPSTWYVNVLAALPHHRGRGLGSALLALAERIAAAERLSGLSLIVADNNAGGRRLYARSGYRERARRPMVKEGWVTRGSEWILMVKTL